MSRLLIEVPLSFLDRLSPERGQVMAEYAIIIALIAVSTLTLTLIVLRSRILTAFEVMADCITNLPC